MRGEFRLKMCELPQTFDQTLEGLSLNLGRLYLSMNTQHRWNTPEGSLVLKDTSRLTREIAEQINSERGSARDAVRSGTSILHPCN